MSNRNSRVHKYSFGVVLEGRALRPTRKVVCLLTADFSAERRFHGLRLEGLTRWGEQTAEYNARDKAGAIAQFEREFPRYRVINADE